ncbi:MAG: hypothetical protein FJ291_04680 [Planctomycetes bacterium]|nr:hypothetical protein [Planctomycetota bacterium]
MLFRGMTMAGSRKNEIILTLGFLGTIAGVPLAQVALELRRGERVQYTDLFRYPPTERNLRQFERTLEDKSWFQQAVRPEVQRFLLLALRDAGAKAIIGQGRWFYYPRGLFYRPGVRYLVESSQQRWHRPPACGDAVAQAIIRFRDQLRERGIELLVVPVPEKASVYPDRLTRRMAGRFQDFRSPTEGLLEDLKRSGVESVDLFRLFREARRRGGDVEDLYLTFDTHWTPGSARVAAEAVAQRLRALRWAPSGEGVFPAGRGYTIRPAKVARRGDIVEMIQAPRISRVFPAEGFECVQVLDKSAGLLVSTVSGREGTYMNQHLVDTPLQASVLLLGDSFSRIYQTLEPQSLGEELGQAGFRAAELGRENVKGTRRLLPGSAGFPSHLALALGAAVDYIISDGGAATDVRQALSTNAEILERKRVVVWQFAERDIGLGAEGWRDVPLPPRLD